MRSKDALLGLFFILVTGAASNALAQVVEYRGTVTITKVTGACQGWAVGDTAQSRFFPGGVGDNVGDNLFTGLALYFTYFAESYTFEGPYTDLRQGVPIEVLGVGLGRAPYVFDSTMQLTSLRPGRLKASTKFIRMVATVNDFDAAAGCNVEFRGSYNKRLR